MRHNGKKHKKRQPLADAHNTQIVGGMVIYFINNKSQKRKFFLIQAIKIELPMLSGLILRLVLDFLR